MHNEELNETKIWLLSLGAILDYPDKRSHRYLYKTENDKSLLDVEYIEKLKYSLKRDWDIGNAMEMKWKLQSIMNFGCARWFNEERWILNSLSENGRIAFLERTDRKTGGYRLVNKYDKEMPLTGIRAWDYSKYVYLFRSALILGYYSETEFWGCIYEIGKKVQSEYLSWREYAIAYFAGREYDLGSITGEDINVHFEQIDEILFQDKGIWRNLKWDTKLVL